MRGEEDRCDATSNRVLRNTRSERKELMVVSVTVAAATEPLKAASAPSMVHRLGISSDTAGMVDPQRFKRLSTTV